MEHWPVRKNNRLKSLNLNKHGNTAMTLMEQGAGLKVTMFTFGDVVI